MVEDIFEPLQSKFRQFLLPLGAHTRKHGERCCRDFRPGSGRINCISLAGRDRTSAAPVRTSRCSFRLWHRTGSRADSASRSRCIRRWHRRGPTGRHLRLHGAASVRGRQASERFQQAETMIHGRIHSHSLSPAQLLKSLAQLVGQRPWVLQGRQSLQPGVQGQPNPSPLPRSRFAQKEQRPTGVLGQLFPRIAPGQISPLVLPNPRRDTPATAALPLVVLRVAP
jgi:hypothetical protein